MRIRLPRAAMAPAVLLAAAALLGAVPAARAQTPFALTNIGADVRVSDARVAGRGGWGVAESDSLLPSFHNPAGLAGLRRTAVVVSGYGESVESESDDASRRNNRVFTPSLRVAMPAASGRIVIHAGLTAQRATQYETAQPTTWTVGDAVLGGTDYFRREGTQFTVPLGVALRLTPTLSVAGGLDLAFGVVRDRSALFFEDPVRSDGTPYYALSSEVVEDEISGASTTWSMQWRPTSRFGMGFQWTTAHDWDITRTRELGGVKGSRVSESVWHLPARWQAGADLRLDSRWRMGFEYEAQSFSEFSGRADWEAAVTDAWRVSAGLDRSRADERRGGLGNLPLRLGYSLSRWPYTVEGAEILDHRVSVGTGVPFRGAGGHLDMALSYGWTGSREDHGVEDRYWRFTVSLAGLEKWW